MSPVLKSCPHHGLYTPTTYGCPTCNRTRRPSSHARGYDRRWREMVALAIQFYGRCAHCGTTEDLTGDHRNPAKRTNLTVADVDVLCRSCNARKGNRVA